MPKKHRHKQPKGIIKQPTPHDHQSTQQKRPTFSFHSISKDYCISKCTKPEKASLADTLRKMSESTWAELHNKERHCGGYEKINRNAIKAPIPRSISDDVKFLAFRFYENAPMVGYRELEMFHVLWLDRRFKLYNH